VDLQAIIRAAIEIGDRAGFITFDQLNELTLSYADRVEPEDIEVLLEALSARGINLTGVVAAPTWLPDADLC
jgi:hypothetical protein